MNRENWIREKRRDLEDLQGIATNAIVPSRRDFSQFIASQRRDLALVARLKRCDPQTGGAWPHVDLGGLAQLLDDTDIAAFAVHTDGLHGMAAGDLDAIGTTVSAPVLRDDLCLDETQVYDSRLRGADALRIPMAELVDDEVEKLCDIAVSLHMTPVLEVGDEDSLGRVPVRAPNCIGLSCSALDGFVDLVRVRSLAARVPRHIVVVVLAEVRNVDEALDLRGVVDGVVVGDVLLNAGQPEVEVARFLAP